MAPTDLPDPAPDIADAWLLGAWYILFTNHGFWQRRTHPRVEYTALEPDGDRPRMLDALRFRQVDMLGREQRKLLLGVDVAERPGQYLWRGQSVLKVIKRRWCVALIDPEQRWLVAWFARANVGTAPGLDICTRDPSISQALLDEILAQIRAHPFLGQSDRRGQPRRCDGLFATVQDWIPPRPYRLIAD